jgi:hypothetical protein
MELRLVPWLICGIAATFVASSRGANDRPWAFLGLLLGEMHKAGAGKLRKEPNEE